MKLKVLPVLIFSILTLHFAVSGQGVNLSCTEVLPGGDVLLQWKPLLVGASFNNYTIFVSSALAGPYSQLISITDISQDNYIHTNAGANFAQNYYYIITNKDTGPSPPSDTLATMLLSATTADFEVVDFSWTPIHYQPEFLPDMHPWYLLYREYPPGILNIVDSTQQTSITHHFWACNADNDSVRFRIGIRDTNIGCVSFSNQKGAILNNLSNDIPPVIDSVSIDVNGNVVIGWEAGQEPDIQGYKIFTVTSAADSVAYIDGRFTTFYTHPGSDPCAGPLSYLILTIDSCGNESPFPYDSATLLDKPQTTIYLSDILYDPCLMTNTLTWNEYRNFDPPLDYSSIFYCINGGPFALLDNIQPGVTSFTHLNLLPNTTYSYYIRAYSGDHLKSSTSCPQAVTTYDSPRPLFMYTRYVTVVNSEQADIYFYTDTNAHVQYYRILRGTLPEGPFTEAGTVAETGEEYIYFSDPVADVNSGSYYYQVEVVDSCGIASVIANLSRTIFLQVQSMPDLTNVLNWNAYESWGGRVLGYNVYRSLDDAPPEIIGQTDSLTLTFPDNVSGLTASVSKITYFVEAFEGYSNPMGFREVSRSNQVLSEQEPRAYMPNVIMPLGLNNTLKPVTVFVGSDGYEFLVYNRWGQLIFRTEDPDEAWDARINGQLVQGGVYVYLLRFKNAMGQPRQVKGNVAVIY
jgi:hypothetical protein